MITFFDSNLIYRSEMGISEDDDNDALVWLLLDTSVNDFTVFFFNLFIFFVSKLKTKNNNTIFYRFNEIDFLVEKI